MINTAYGDFITRIIQQHNYNLPFVAYRKPNSNKLRAYLQKNASINYLRDYEDSGFVMAPFSIDEGVVFYGCKNCLGIECYHKPESLNKMSYHFENNDDLEWTRYKELVSKTIEAIKNTDLNKVVLSRQDTLEIKNFNAIETFQTLLNTYPSAFVYLWFHPKIGLWLGATPERFLKLDGRNFKTVALAGTNKTGEKDWTSKEIEEQAMVSHYLQDVLSQFASNLNITKTETVKAGNLFHIKTIITGRLNVSHDRLENLFKALHPTPAVCGLPKENAKGFILNNENYDRQFYTGFLGELNLKSENQRESIRRNTENKAYFSDTKITDLYVNLRCMQIFEDYAKIYVGGGITKDSVPELEWQETVQKANTMKTVLR